MAGFRNRTLRRITFAGAGIVSVLAVLASLCITSCNTVDSDRIPAYAVNISLTPVSVWQTYGVTSFGDTRRFVRELHEPSNFAWLERTRTGFGGVLLVCGMDPFTTESNVPIAYDLACPVECKSNVRVAMVTVEEYPFPVAQCPECKSRYDVIEGGGRPLSGKALTSNYGLRIYGCMPVDPTKGGGYLVMNR